MSGLGWASDAGKWKGHLNRMRCDGKGRLESKTKAAARAASKTDIFGFGCGFVGKDTQGMQPERLTYFWWTSMEIFNAK